MSIFPDTLVNKVSLQLDPEAVLRKIAYRTEMIQNTGDQIKAFCPIHNETVFRTLIIDVADRQFKCSNHRCEGHKGGDLIELYALAQGIHYDQAIPELAALFEIPIDMAVIEEYLAQTLEVAKNYCELQVWDEAEANYRRILNFKPDCREALEALITIYRSQEQWSELHATRDQLIESFSDEQAWDKVLDLLKQALAESPDDEELLAKMIEALVKAEEPDWAARECLHLAELLRKRGEIDSALAQLRRARGLNPDDTEAPQRINALLLNTGRLDEVIDEYLENVENCIRDTDYEGAFDALEEALFAAPERHELVVREAEIIVQAGLGAMRVDSLSRRIDQLLSAREHGPAAQALDALESYLETYPRLLLLRARLLEARGDGEAALKLKLRCLDLHQERGQLEDALAVLDTIGSLEKNVPLLSRKASLLREKGDTEAAVSAYLTLADLFEKSDEYEHAAAVMQTIVDLQPERLDHRQQQLEYYLKLGNEQLVIEKALALAEALNIKKEIDRAVEMLERALKILPDRVELLQAQGEIYHKADRRGEAAEQYLSAARAAFDHGESDRARRLTELALKCVPEHLEAREIQADLLESQQMHTQAISIYTDLAEFFLRENDVQRVVALCQKILKISPDHMQTLQTLSKAWKKSGNTEEELKTELRLVELYTKGQSFTRAQEICEDILAQNEDYTPALELMAEIAKAAGHANQSTQYLWRLSQVHAQAGRSEQERGVLELLLEQEPLSQRTWYRYLELLASSADIEKLNAVLARCTSLFGEADQLKELSQLLEDLCSSASPKAEFLAALASLYETLRNDQALRLTLRQLAELLGKQLRDAEALETWERLFRCQPDDLSILRTRIEIMLRNDKRAEAANEYRRLGEKLREQNQMGEATVALQESLNLSPGQTEARDALIEIALRDEDPAQAIELINQAASDEIEAERPDAAIALYARLFEVAPDHEETYRKVIAIQQRMGDVASALGTFALLLDCLERTEATTEFESAALEAVRLEPDGWQLRRRLAKFYLNHDRQSDAESALVALVVRHIERGETDEADKIIDEILEVNPQSVPARAHRAQLLARQGQTDEALQAFMSLTGSLNAVPGAAMIPAQAPLPPSPFGPSNYIGMPLVEAYTFDSFIVGSRNNFAHATALAVSRAPGKNYNPLFLYSEVGMGKTHLCHAIANQIVAQHPEMRVIYTSTDEFVAELIEAIQRGEIANLRHRHKMTDVLIVDDVQFLTGREQAQEEFFHVFNAIFQAGKQVVLTSDRPPKDIAHLERRLKSRFGAGMIVDIQPPDLETRMAILRHEVRQRAEDRPLPDEVLQCIADNVDMNVRELKGALIQVLARQELTGEEITIDVARQVLNQYIDNADED